MTKSKIRFPMEGRVHFTHVRCRVIAGNPLLIDCGDTVTMEDVTTGKVWATVVTRGTGKQFIRDTFGLEPLPS